MDVIGMQGLDSAILESDPDRSFYDADSTFKDFFTGHDNLSLSCSLSYFEIIKIKEFSILVGMNQDKWFSLMQEHISHFITFLKFNGFDSSCSLSHRSEIAALVEEHPSMFGQDTDIISIIYRFHTQDFFFLCKFHDYSREFLE